MQDSSNLPTRFSILIETAILTALLAAMGWFVVAAHTNTIWMDPEFTGWVAPIANRLAGGMILYTDGAHMPIPPFSFVLLRALTGGEAIWLHESALIFVFQSATILALYWGASALLPRPVPFLAALATVPVFLALPKTVLYDAPGQFFVAVAGVTGVMCVRNIGSSSAGLGIGKRALAWLATAAGASALCLFSKQSTAAGGCIGVVALLLFMPARGQAGIPVFHRVRAAALYTVLTGLIFFALALACSKYLSVGGLVNDVFISGNEPKGGVGRTLNYLGSYVIQISMTVAVAALLIGLAARLLGLERAKGTGEAHATIGSDVRAPSPVWPATVGIIVTGMCLAGLYVLSPRFSYVDQFSLQPLLEAGLVLCLIAGGLTVLSIGRGVGDKASVSALHPIVAMTFVFLPAAMFTSLSDPLTFERWTYDNNPMIFIAFAAILLMLWRIARGMRPGMRRGAILALMTLPVMAGWAGFNERFDAIRQCTETWPEVKVLRGARMPKRAEGLREFIRVVREFAPDPELDEVLLLPGAPDVEAWFERPVPDLSCPIIFVDQYWDRYVDNDLGRLAAAPPRVIVIGPHDYWRDFFHNWRRNWGAERLIDRIRYEMIAPDYELRASVRFNFRGGTDYFNIFVWKDDAGAEAGKEATSRNDGSAAPDGP